MKLQLTPFHFFRESSDFLFAQRAVYQSAPENAPAVRPAPTTTAAPETDEMRTAREKLTELKSTLDAPATAATLMKYIEEHAIDTSDWAGNPQAALTFFRDFQASADGNKLSTQAVVGRSVADPINILINFLTDPGTQGDPIAQEKFKLGKEVAISIAENIGRRKAELGKAKDELDKMQTNGLNRKAGDFIGDVWERVGRMSTPEKIAAFVGSVMLTKMMFADPPIDPATNKPHKTLFGFLKTAVPVIFGVNLGSEIITGKSGFDWIDEKTGVFSKYSPNAKRQMPEFMRALSEHAAISQPSELKVMGKLADVKMSTIMGTYDASVKREDGKIDHRLFGFGDTEITDEDLYLIVDTLVKKHEMKPEPNKPGILKRNVDSFKNTFAGGNGSRDYTFMEAAYYLFEADAVSMLMNTLDPKQKAEKVARLRKDTDELFKQVVAYKPHVQEWGDINFYGVDFLVKETEDRNGNPRFSYWLNDSTPVSIGSEDSNDMKEKSVNSLQAIAKEHIVRKISKEGAGTTLVQKDPQQFLKYDSGAWMLPGVSLNNGGNTDIIISEGRYGILTLTRKDGGKAPCILEKGILNSTHFLD